MTDFEKIGHTEPAPTEGMVTRTIRQQAERIEELENILTVIIDEGWLGGYHIEKCARRVLWGNNE